MLTRDTCGICQLTTAEALQMNLNDQVIIHSSIETIRSDQEPRNSKRASKLISIPRDDWAQTHRQQQVSLAQVPLLLLLLSFANQFKPIKRRLSNTSKQAHHQPNSNQIASLGVTSGLSAKQTSPECPEQHQASTSSCACSSAFIIHRRQFE